VAVDAALQRKAEQVRVLDMRGVTHLADFFLVCHGSNPRQVQAIAEAIEAGLRAAGARVLHVEGRERGLWVLLDFGFLVAHVFQEASREFYGLEKLWSDAGDVTGELVASEGSRDA
jgi:ribosome-associated protein